MSYKWEDKEDMNNITYASTIGNFMYVMVCDNSLFMRYLSIY